MNASTGLAAADPLEAGRGALSRGEWEEAHACFEAALERGESAEAIEALGMAAWWLDDADGTSPIRPSFAATRNWPPGEATSAAVR